MRNMRAGTGNSPCIFSMDKVFKVGDIVYLKSESMFPKKRIWKVIHITENGIHHLERNVRGFNFLETVKADELVLLEE